MKSEKLKSRSVKSISQPPKRSRKEKCAPEHGRNEWHEGFMKAVRKLREDYDPGYGEFVRSIRDADIYSGQPRPKESK